MNKLFILFLALCLVSVHAFVKRDAPEAPKNDDTVQKMFDQGKETFGKIGEELQKIFDPKVIQEGYNKLATGAKNTWDQLVSTEAPKA